MELPPGYISRPLTMADAPAVTAVMAAQELADLGEVVIEEADIVGDWQRPSYDVEANTVGVLAVDGRLVAYAEVGPGGRCDAAVHPDHQGLGIGTALAGWTQELARAQGQSEIGMPVPQGSPGDRLLEALGYRVRWSSWVLQLPPGVDVPSRELPPAYAVRGLDPADPDEIAAVWTVCEDAFLEWSVRERSTFEDWDAGVTQRPGYEPWQLRVVTDPADEIVAAAVLMMTTDTDASVGPVGTGFVAKLATRADQRGRGLAQALLVDAFAQARAHGATRCELSTDSRTGALGLYEKVGMVVTSTWVNRGITV